MGIQKHTMTKNELINAIKKEKFKEIVVYEPVDQVALSAIKKMKPDDKTTILVLKN